MTKEYDWIWRRDGNVMTFRRLYFEGLEVCSPGLYLRRLLASQLVEESYMCGLDLFAPKTANSDRRDESHLLNRLIEQAFVRAYLMERRAGLKPRAPGPPPETREVMHTAIEAVHREQDAARDREKFKREAHVRKWKPLADKVSEITRAANQLLLAINTGAADSEIEKASRRFRQLTENDGE